MSKQSENALIEQITSLLFIEGQDCSDRAFLDLVTRVCHGVLANVKKELTLRS